MKQTNSVTRGMATAVFGAAAIGTALPAVANLAPSVYSYLSTSVKAQLSERIASAASDGVMQYVANIPEYGLGGDNLSNINLSSVGLNFIAPNSNVISAVGGSAFEFNLADRYKGVGSGKKSLGAFTLQSLLGTGGNLLGNKLGCVFGKYGDGGAFLNTFSGNTIGNGVSNTIQTITNEATKPAEEEPK